MEYCSVICEIYVVNVNRKIYVITINLGSAAMINFIPIEQKFENIFNV